MSALIVDAIGSRKSTTVDVNYTGDLQANDILLLIKRLMKHI